MTLQKQILIVDDDPVNRADLRTILTPEYRVLETENGAQALGVLRERPDEIALILLDLVLPGMDGCAFLAQAKAEQALASIPVIVTTRQDSEAAEIAALSGGAADFVVKPYRPQVILHRIANIIRLRETSAMICQGAVRPADRSLQQGIFLSAGQAAAPAAPGTGIRHHLL